MGSFTSPGIDTRQKGPPAFSVSSERHRQMWGEEILLHEFLPCTQTYIMKPGDLSFHKNDVSLLSAETELLLHGTLDQCLTFDCR